MSSSCRDGVSSSYHQLVVVFVPVVTMSLSSRHCLRVISFSSHCHRCHCFFAMLSLFPRCFCYSLIVVPSWFHVVALPCRCCFILLFSLSLPPVDGNRGRRLGCLSGFLIYHLLIIDWRFDLPCAVLDRVKEQRSGGRSTRITER